MQTPIFGAPDLGNLDWKANRATNTYLLCDIGSNIFAAIILDHLQRSLGARLENDWAAFDVPSKGYASAKSCYEVISCSQRAAEHSLSRKWHFVTPNDYRHRCPSDKDRKTVYNACACRVEKVLTRPSSSGCCALISPCLEAKTCHDAIPSLFGVITKRV